MDLRKWLMWAAFMLLLGVLYATVNGTEYRQTLSDWWLMALVSAIVIAWVPGMTIEFETEMADWLAWVLILGVGLLSYGWLFEGSALALYTKWHCGVAVVSAVVMYYFAPWSKRFIPA
jgi:hypothetical protein